MRRSAHLFGAFALDATAALSASPLTIPHQLTHSQNMDPSFRPDGQRMVYISVVAGKEQLFVMNTDGSGPFASNRNARYQSFVMKPDGSDVELVANTEGRATVPRWTPDGKAIYFTNCVSKDFGSDCEILVSRLPASSGGIPR